MERRLLESWLGLLNKRFEDRGYFIYGNDLIYCTLGKAGKVCDMASIKEGSVVDGEIVLMVENKYEVIPFTLLESGPEF